ncbi:hypothetical protein JNK13_01690 [bacterium]|nr:hypothetical protein [bacterium]
MHLDFAEELSAIIATLYGQELQAETLKRTPEFPGVRVCDIPGEGDISSSAPFKLAKLYRAQLQRLVSPVEISERIIQGFAGSKNFTLMRGGQGFLNATATDNWKQQFLLLVLEQPWEALLSRLQVSTAVISPIDLRQLIRSINFEPLELLVQVRGDVAAFSANDYLMALALIADRELDANAYLKNLNGRRNIPWFIKYFLNQSSQYTLDEKTRRELIGRLNPLQLFGCLEFLPLWTTLFAVRHNFELAQRLRQPEILVREIVNLGRAFFYYYNSPKVRAELALNTNSKYRLITNIVHELARFLLRTLRVNYREISE